jgi:DNA polymerase-3 subunit alpha
VDKIWKDWLDFAQYAFNKSHSTCYAYVAYHTAYLKAHYPSEYLAAVLNNSGDIARITFFMQECKRMGLTVLGPDVNESQKGFSVNMGGVIRFGLGAIKGVGDAAVEELIENRTKHGKFVDVFDMVKRLSSRTVSKKTLETLIMGGALDCITDIHRGQYFHIAPGEMQSNLEKIIKFGQQVSSASNTMLNSLFGDAGMPEATQPKLSNCDEWTLTEKLEREKEMVGIYISAHPLDGFSFEMNNFGFMPLSEIENENLKGKTLT